MNTLLYQKCLSIYANQQHQDSSFDLLSRKKQLTVGASLASYSEGYAKPLPYFDAISQTTSKVGFRNGIHLYFPIQEWMFEKSRSSTQAQGKSQKSKQSIEVLLCRKKIKLFYGALQSKKLHKILEQADFLKKKQYNFAKNFFSLIESRLDVVLYRSGFAKTIRAARQAIRHSKVYVNSKRCRVASTLCKPGDFISFCGACYEIKESAFFYKKLRKERKVSFIDEAFSLENAAMKENKTINSLLSSNQMASFKVLSLSMRRNSVAALLLALFCLHRIRNQLDILETSNINKISNSKKVLKFSPLTDTSDIQSYQKITLDWVSSFLEKQGKGYHHEMMVEQGKNLPISWNKAIDYFGSNLELNSCTLAGKIQKYYLINDKSNLSTNKAKNIKLKGSLRSFQKELASLEIEQKKEGVAFLDLHNIEKRPTHLEVSKISNSIIFLYSPQKISLPFHIDIDILRKI